MSHRRTLSLGAPIGAESIRATAVLFLSGAIFLTAVLQLIDLWHLTYTFVYRPRIVSVNFVEWPAWTAASLLLGALLLPNARRAMGSNRLGAALPVVAIVGPVLLIARAFPTDWVVLCFSALIAFLMLVSAEVIGSTRREVLNFWTVTVLLLLLIAELGAAVVWIQYPLSSSFPFTGAPIWKWAGVALGIFYIGYAAGPYLVALLFSAWTWVPPLVWVARRRWDLSSDLRMIVSLPASITKRPTLYSILILLALSAILGAYAILSTKIPIGADARKFIPFLRVPLDWPYINSLLTWNARGGYILFLYGLMDVTGLGPEATFNIQPIIFAFLLSGFVFFLVRSTTDNTALALLSGLFTVFSGQSVVAMLYAAYPNWLAMIAMMAFLFFAIKSEMEKKWRYAVLAQLAVFAILVTHYWTWAAGLAILAIYMVVRVVRSVRTKMRYDLRFPLGIIVLNILLAYFFLPTAFRSDITLRQLFTGIASYPELWATNDLGEIVSTFVYYLMHPRLGSVFSTLSYSLNQVGAGFFNQSWLFLLAAVGLCYLHRSAGRLGDLMLSWTFFSFLATLLIDPFLQWRIMYIYPLGIALAAGSIGVANFVAKYTGPFQQTARLCTTVVLLLVSVNYALAATGYLFLLIPGLAGG